MEIIQINRGGVKVCDGGYTYTKKYSNKSTIIWECSQRRGRSCKGALLTDIQVNLISICSECRFTMFKYFIAIKSYVNKLFIDINFIGLIYRRLRGLAVACWTTDHYNPCSNLGVGISEGCFIFDFASLPLGVARPI